MSPRDKRLIVFQGIWYGHAQALRNREDWVNPGGVTTGADFILKLPPTKGIKKKPQDSDQKWQTPGPEAQLQAGKVHVTMEFNKDRPDMDYKTVPLTDFRSETCRDACAKDTKCKAYTFGKPRDDGSKAGCWLKKGVAAVKSNPC